MTTKQLTIIEKQVAPVITEASQLAITGTDTLTLASTLRENIKRVQKEIEDDKEELYRPIKTALDEVNARYAPFEKPLKEALKIVNDKMGAYQTQVLKDKQEKEAKIAARIGINLGVEKAMEKINALESPAELDMTGFMKKQILVITDTSLIPREYLIPDEKAIETALKAGIEVPGALLEVRLIPKSK